MNTLEIRTHIHQKLTTLTPEQLTTVWNFLESLNPQEQQPPQTVLEKMGGYPEFFEGSSDLSDRNIPKKIIAERIQQRHQQRHQ